MFSYAFVCLQSKRVDLLHLMLIATRKEIAVKDLEVDVTKDTQDSTDDEDNTTKQRNGKQNGTAQHRVVRRALTDDVSAPLGL